MTGGNQRVEFELKLRIILISHLPPSFPEFNTMNPFETTLTIIDGSSANDRLLVVLCHTIERGSRIELRQQTWGDGVGWFTQNTVPLAPEQVGPLRNALGGTGSMRPKPTSRSHEGEGFAPRVVHAETA